MRNGMGSWRFVFAFLGFMAVWALVNSLARGWDPYPFILLNLFLSMLAGLQGAILLIAAKRQDAIAADLARHDYDTNIAAKRDVEVLLEVNATQLEILRTLQEDVRVRLEALERAGGRGDRVGDRPGPGEARAQPCTSATAPTRPAVTTSRSASEVT